ncbi:hypothetical protein EVAR_90321_1 [Eumeta japonica]|uniref:Uncharacterized protein n=1 Tax=Eumeta variegata TaxID=151549 RepID=A0A4C1ZPK1_EUMVA|nr:hypothetical protein EVAR_90321_1 [Eumeta japonica]
MIYVFLFFLTPPQRHSINSRTNEPNPCQCPVISYAELSSKESPIGHVMRRRHPCVLFGPIRRLDSFTECGRISVPTARDMRGRRRGSRLGIRCRSKPSQVGSFPLMLSRRRLAATGWSGEFRSMNLTNGGSQSCR